MADNHYKLMTRIKKRLAQLEPELKNTMLEINSIPANDLEFLLILCTFKYLDFNTDLSIRLKSLELGATIAGILDISEDPKNLKNFFIEEMKQHSQFFNTVCLNCNQN